ncbi:MAG: hypothetical protein RI894_1111 [Bacteroidota bacterium]|jgi:hypothetical protein
MKLITTFVSTFFAISSTISSATASSKPYLFDKLSNDLQIEKEFSVNGRFYTHSEQGLSPQIGYYRLSLISPNGETIRSNPFTVSDDFSREAFAFCCDEPDMQVIAQSSVTVIDGIADQE